MSTTPLTNTPVRTEQSPVAQTVPPPAEAPPDKSVDTPPDTSTPQAPATSVSDAEDKLESKTPRDGFRVPNSVIQGLTSGSGDATGFNKMTAFEMVTLLGLMTLLDPKKPYAEVATTPSKLMAITAMSRQVSHFVDRTWTQSNGRRQHRRYESRRFNPKELKVVNNALLSLYNKSLSVRTRVPSKHKRGSQVVNRIVHVLDMFGYRYKINQQGVDVDDLPPGFERLNVGIGERPVWRVRRAAAGTFARIDKPAARAGVSDGSKGGGFERPVGVVFRLNKELAAELTHANGTIGYTIMARRVFALLRQHMRNAAMIRLIILVLRQTGEEFSRNLIPITQDLGYDTTHQTRAVQQLRKNLDTLQASGVIRRFVVDVPGDRMRVGLNRGWSEGPPEGSG